MLAEALGCEPEPGASVDVHHNHVGEETHQGRVLLVHRKGDIAEVLEDEAELVTPVLRLTPIAVLKG